MKTIRIAVPVPLRQVFDYLPLDTQMVVPVGARVRVPFQSRELIGICLGEGETAGKLKTVLAVLDEEPMLPVDILELCLWAADYYHFPLGEVLSHAMPKLLREGGDYPSSGASRHLLPQGEKGLRTKKVAALSGLGVKNVAALSGIGVKNVAALSGLSVKNVAALSGLGVKNVALRCQPLEEVMTTDHPLQSSPPPAGEGARSADEGDHLAAPALDLNPEQTTALEKILHYQNQFQVLLLDGVTGSGKTEVYLQAIAEVLSKAGAQVLVLVPEIGLTPQTIQRFRERFAVPVVAIHSAVREKEKKNVWLAAKSGDARIVIGTRSAVFTPFINLSLIIVDEEHDLSFKQQEGFRYHARDLAIMRAHFTKIPIVLGSATPSLETLHKAQRQQYEHLKLTLRAGNAEIPHFQILDIRKADLDEGLSHALITSIRHHLAAGNQVMLFLNRRGFAPVLICHDCGWLALCKRCDARMTYHQQPKYLHCHHCDSRRRIPLQCEACPSKNLTLLGLGTERLEVALTRLFPNYSIARIDRDNTRRKGKMESLLSDIQNGTHQILIGTQMLAKGHHFPNVTLVAIVDADNGFFSADFRALERMGQLILQVSGRAGRVAKKGEVLIQTHHPEHPLLQHLVHDQYTLFAETLLQERSQALLPPYSFFALFRAEAHQNELAQVFLEEIKKVLGKQNDLQIFGPIPAPMPKRAGKHRMQLLLQSNKRRALHDCLKNIIPKIDKFRAKQKVKWSLDVDPLEMF